MSTTLKYPYNWGKPIVNAFVEKYARGTYYLARMLHSDPGTMRHRLILCLCSGNSLQFESVKKVIKGLEDYELDDLRRLGPEACKVLYKRLYGMAVDEVLDENIAKITIDSRNFKA